MTMNIFTRVKMSKVTTVIFLLASLTSCVTSMKCWQCAAVDGRKCPEDAKSVTSVGNVNFIFTFVSVTHKLWDLNINFLLL